MSEHEGDVTKEDKGTDCAEQLWVVRIVSREEGKVERWVVSPAVGPQVPRSTLEVGLARAIQSANAEDENSETWDCRQVETDGVVEWVCTLKRSGRITGPEGHVFEFSERAESLGTSGPLPLPEGTPRSVIS